jgi:nicotinate-nucleotide pyrophosphorylase (carboxylating)
MVIAEVTGRLRALLTGERTALNFLQRLSGIATNVSNYMLKIPPGRPRLVDTRKTTPGLRVLEKYAVRCGGAGNHRMGLYGGILIKDNHIAVAGGVARAIDRVKRQAPHLMKIEVEVSDIGSTIQALEAGADVIMLDNMELDKISEAVKIIGGRAEVEVSGGVTKTDLSSLASTGVDIISVGALTHAARSVDISMRLQSR